jgi:hypothetical protein
VSSLWLLMTTSPREALPVAIQSLVVALVAMRSLVAVVALAPLAGNACRKRGRRIPQGCCRGEADDGGGRHG